MPTTQLLDREVEYKPFLSTDSIKLSVGMVLKFLCKPTKKGLVCDEAQAMRFVMLCKSRGLNPWEGDAFIVGYDTQDGPEFNLITAHQAFLKRAEVHPQYKGLQSGVVVRRKDAGGNWQTVDTEGDYVEDGDVLAGGWARVLLREREPMYKRLKLATFNKGFSRWKVDPAGMIVKCAEADALRSAFPNSLGGMYLNEEISPYDAIIEHRPTTPALPLGRTSLRGTNGTPPPADEQAQPGPSVEQYQAQEPPTGPDSPATKEQWTEIDQLIVDKDIVTHHWRDDFKKRHNEREPQTMTQGEATEEISRLMESTGRE